MTLRFSRVGWAALSVHFADSDGDLDAYCRRILLFDRDAFPAATPPAPIAHLLIDARARLGVGR